MTRLFHNLAGVTTLAAALSAVGQAVPFDPANTGQGGHTLPYRSAFTDYTPYRDMPRADWHALNDAVRDPDGHAGAPATAASAAPASRAASAGAAPAAAHPHHPTTGDRR